MKSALFILPVATQPRFSKRINSFLLRNYKVTAAIFERNYFNLNKLPESIEIINLGKIKSGNYIRRIPTLLKSLRCIIKLSRNQDKVYIFSADILLLAGIFISRNKIIYEIGDIREIQNQRFISFIFFVFYRKMLQRCSSIIVTSAGFKKYMIEKYSVRENKITVIENKLQEGSFFTRKESIPFRPIQKNFTIGIIGFLRYRNIINFLEAYKKSPINRFRIAIHGDGQLKDEILQYVDNETIKFFGQYRYPHDIKAIYNNIDISFLMYDSDNLNVRLALPNKLYESMYFKKPLIVSSHTYLSEITEKYQIGFTWDQKKMTSLIEYLNSDAFIKEYNLSEEKFIKIDVTEYLETNSNYSG